MVLVGAGAVKHDELVKLSDKHFSSLPSKAIDPSDIRRAPKHRFTGSMINVKDDTMEDVHVAVAFESVGWTHPDYYTFLVIQQILGNWDRTIGAGKNSSSALCEIFATHTLGSSLSTFNTCYNHTGLFGNYVITDAHHTDDALHQVFREYQRIGKNVHDSEVQRAKLRLKSSLLMSLDGTTPTAEEIGRQMLALDRRLSPAEIFTRIDSIQTKDVHRVAEDYFEDVDPAVVAIGPLGDFPDYNVMREWTSWRRV